MNLTFQPVEFRHLTWLKTQRNKPEIMEFCRNPYMMTEQTQEEWLKNCNKNRDMVPFIVVDTELKADASWIGYAALSKIDNIASHAECSYFVDPTYKGRGYGQEIVFQLLKYGFLTLGLQKIYSDTFEYNVPEIEMNKLCGFEEGGKLIRHYFKRGNYINSVQIYMLREKFDEHYANRLSKFRSFEGKPL